jgi:hypothetical protein
MGISMNKYWYDYILEDNRKYEDNKSTVYDSDNLNELASWKINETGFQMT